MYKVKIVNSNGEELTLTQRENDYQITNIIGLNPPNANIVTTPIVGTDGARFNSAKLETREIVLTVVINGNVAANRMRLFNFFPTKDKVKIYYSSPVRSVFIEGYVSSFEVGLFDQHQTAQIAILCPYPYFKGMDEILLELSSRTSLFTFPFSIETPIPFSEVGEEDGGEIFNSSTVEVGALIRLVFTGAVSTLTITDNRTGEFFKISYSFQADDVVEINTRKGEKSVKLYRDGDEISIFSAVDMDSTFFQLRPGENSFRFTADVDYVSVYFNFRNEYRGV